MRLIAVSNGKGGSAKTCVTVNLAAALGERGKRCLVIDLDPSANASTYLGVKDGGKDLIGALVARVAPGMGGVDRSGFAEIARPSSAPGVDIVASSRWLDNVERVMIQMGIEEEDHRLSALKLLIGEIPPDRWDFVFLDTPPTFGFLVHSVFRATEEVLIPVEASSSAVPGLRDLFRTLRASVEKNPRLKVSGVIACRVLVAGANWAVVCRELVEDMRRTFGDSVFTHVIRETIKLRETMGHGLPITVYDPTGHGAQDFRAIATELENKVPRSLAVRQGAA